MGGLENHDVVSLTHEIPRGRQPGETGTEHDDSPALELRGLATAAVFAASQQSGKGESVVITFGKETADKDVYARHSGSDLLFAVSPDLVRMVRELDLRDKTMLLAMQNVVAAVRGVIPKPFESHVEAVNCHHNYVNREHHFGRDILVTRKGAVSARKGELGIIPGSMGARSYIVRGLGNEDSFHSCSHGAGRTMSRTEARKRFTVEDHRLATAGVECRKDADVIDETPAAYKDIDAVMNAQRDLVEVVHTLKQVVCVKG